MPALYSLGSIIHYYMIAGDLVTKIEAAKKTISLISEDEEMHENVIPMQRNFNPVQPLLNDHRINNQIDFGLLRDYIARGGIFGAN